MAGNKAVWGIDIGQCALKAVKLSYDAKEDRAVVEAFDFIEHPKILSQPDADPDELVKAALETFLSRNDVDEAPLYMSVPGQAGLARFVKLPPVEAKKIPDIVRFEANQQIPFNLNDVAWDYQRIGAGEEAEGYLIDAEVGIFAIKKETVHKHMTPLEVQGVEVALVQLAPVALYNFAAFDQFKHKDQKPEAIVPTTAEEQAEAKAAGQKGDDEEEAEGDTVVILDIGADNTDVVITNGESIWMRNLPIGGNHFTRALTKEMKLTFAKAEHMKRNATKAPDPKKLYQAMRPVFQDFASELQRSIGYFSTTNRNRTIRKILGVGNGFKLPGLQKFLAQHLQYEVDKVQGLHGFKGEALANPLFVENMPSFCTACGLALQGLRQSPVQTNLLPQDVRLKRMIRDKKPWTLTAASLLLSAFVAVFLMTYAAYSAVKNPAFESPVTRAKSAVTTFRKYESDFTAAKGEFEKTRTEALTTVGLEEAKKRTDWLRVYKAINRCIPARALSADEKVEEMPDVNIDVVAAVYQEDLGAWFGALPDTVKATMIEADKAAAPSGAGWTFQLLGYTYNEKRIEHVTGTLLRKLQDKSMKDEGIDHACLVWHDIIPKWTPKMGSKLIARKIGEGGQFGQGGQPGFGGGRGGMDSSAGMGGMGVGAPGMGGGMGAGAPGGAGGYPGMGGMSAGGPGGMTAGGPGGRMGGGRGDMVAGGSSGMMGGGPGGRMGGGRGGMMNSGGEMEDMSGMLPPEFQSNDPAAKEAGVERYLRRTEFDIQFVWIPKKIDEPAKPADAK